MCVCPRIDPLCFLATKLSLVIELDLLSVLDRAFSVSGCMLCLIAYQYQCNCFPGKIRLRNDLLSVEWDINFVYSLTSDPLLNQLGILIC